jgi:hypothetical protein
MPPHHSESFRYALEVLSKSLVFPPITDDEFNNRVGRRSNISPEEDSSSSSQEEFHELYLQRQGMEFAMPILFEDGMDYIECELYYAAHSSTPSPTKRLSALHKQHQRQLLLSSTISPSKSSSNSSSQKSPSPNNNNKKPQLSSCIRRRRSFSSTTMSNSSNHSSSSSSSGVNYSESESSTNEDDLFGILEHKHNNNNCFQHHHTPQTRRCSFAGTPLLLKVEQDPSPRPSFLRSQSCDDLKRSVGFQKYVQVVTIHSAMDYPPDVRKNLWMSRRELSQSVRRAVVSGSVRRKDNR